MKNIQKSPEELILKQIPENAIALTGTINDAYDFSPFTITKRFNDWMAQVATSVFHHKDSRSISYFYAVEQCRTSDKNHLHFILFRHGIWKETESHEAKSSLAAKLANLYPTKANLEINPYLPKADMGERDWISYITKGDCEHSGFSFRLNREILRRKTVSL